MRRISHRVILAAALAVFLIYAWPGFVGWDTREHFLQARSGIYTDGHPPAVALLTRICEVFVTGPALLLLIQAVTLLVGLFLIFRARIAPVAAALAASAVFLFPFIAGVTGVITKDALMAGPLVIAIGLMLEDSTRSHRLALALLVFASLMRWNTLAATFTPMLLLFRWRPDLSGVRRYVIAIAAWLAVTGVALAANSALTNKREYLWYWSFAYEDIAGTLEYMPDVDDAHMHELLAGVPLVYQDHLHQRFRAIYSPISHYHLMRDSTKLFEIASTETERTAVAEAWKRIVLGHPSAYLHYRWDSFRALIGLDWGDTFSRVYVWFNVIAAPQVIVELQHDATASHLQAYLMRASVWFSLTRMYATVIYIVLGLLLLPLCRTRLEWALVLSGLAYEAQWFFLAATPDARYSHWMVICILVTAILVGARLARSRTRAS